MQVTAITVGYGRTVNLGDYNSARLDITFAAQLDEGEDLDAAAAQLWSAAKANIKAQLAQLKPGNGGGSGGH